VQDCTAESTSSSKNHTHKLHRFKVARNMTCNNGCNMSCDTAADTHHRCIFCLLQLQPYSIRTPAHPILTCARAAAACEAPVLFCVL
jgi:hypothetical protein